MEGVALHSGERVVAHLQPAPPNFGVQFQVNGIAIPARSTHVIDTQLATTLGQKGARIKMVEHLLATLYGLNIDNVLVVMEGAELPVLDGCAAAWCAFFSHAEVEEQKAPVQRFVVQRTVEVKEGKRWARIEPAGSTELDVTIDFDHPSVGRQHFALGLDPEKFRFRVVLGSNLRLRAIGPCDAENGSGSGRFAGQCAGFWRRGAVEQRWIESK